MSRSEAELRISCMVEAAAQSCTLDGRCRPDRCLDSDCMLLSTNQRLFAKSAKQPSPKGCNVQQAVEVWPQAGHHPPTHLVG